MATNYKYTQNGITFNNVKTPAIATGGITVGNNYSANTLTGQLNSISVDATNAVSIDWNGAQLGTTTINTTGELLSH